MPSPLSDEKKLSVCFRVYALYAKYGFIGVSMDETAARAGISKATLYKYFKSKEEIVSRLVDLVSSIIDSKEFTYKNGIEDVLHSLSQVYCAGLFYCLHAGASFVRDLEMKFPAYFAKVKASADRFQHRFTEFGDIITSEGYFRRLCTPLVMEQTVKMLPIIIDKNYLDSHGLTLPVAVKEYYRMFLYQSLSEKYLYVADEESTYDFIPAFVGNIERFMLCE